MSKKLTPWFPGDVKPVRPGIYNVSCRDEWQTGEWYAKFDGDGWLWGWCHQTRLASSEIFNRPQDKICKAPASWRGLARSPK